jgi:hypothetical protein
VLRRFVGIKVLYIFLLERRSAIFHKNCRNNLLSLLFTTTFFPYCIFYCFTFQNIQVFVEVDLNARAMTTDHKNGPLHHAQHFLVMTSAVWGCLSKILNTSKEMQKLIPVHYNKKDNRSGTAVIPNAPRNSSLISDSRVYCLR